MQPHVYFSRRIEEIPLFKAFSGTEGFTGASASSRSPLTTGHLHPETQRVAVTALSACCSGDAAVAAPLCRNRMPNTQDRRLHLRGQGLIGFAAQPGRAGTARCPAPCCARGRKGPRLVLSLKPLGPDVSHPACCPALRWEEPGAAILPPECRLQEPWVPVTPTLTYLVGGRLQTTPNTLAP